MSGTTAAQRVDSSCSDRSHPQGGSRRTYGAGRAEAVGRGCVRNAADSPGRRAGAQRHVLRAGLRDEHERVRLSLTQWSARRDVRHGCRCTGGRLLASEHLGREVVDVSLLRPRRSPLAPPGVFRILGTAPDASVIRGRGCLGEVACECGQGATLPMGRRIRWTVLGGQSNGVAFTLDGPISGPGDFAPAWAGLLRWALNPAVLPRGDALLAASRGASRT